MSLAHGFPPIVGPAPRVLVLGSLPGRRSLEERQYYAQPQNAFWRIMDRLVGAGPDRPYDDRVAALRAASVAVWDVLAAGQREGSLDSAIVKSTIVVNDFGALLEEHVSIDRICFNGQTAAALFRRRVLPVLSARAAALPQITLPSTSPAYASMRFEVKLAAWSAALAPALRERDRQKRKAQKRNV